MAPKKIVLSLSLSLSDNTLIKHNANSCFYREGFKITAIPTKL